MIFTEHKAEANGQRTAASLLWKRKISRRRDTWPAPALKESEELSEAFALEHVDDFLGALKSAEGQRWAFSASGPPGPDT